MGFSPWGVGVSLAVLLPNLVLAWAPPRDGYPAAPVPLFLTSLERAGQALCLVIPAIVAPAPLRWWWMLPLIAALVGYYLLWMRYLTRGRTAGSLFEPVWRVPVPMAILPVIAFAAAAVWLGNPWLAAAALILGVGHIPASIIRARALAGTGTDGVRA